MGVTFAIAIVGTAAAAYLVKVIMPVRITPEEALMKLRALSTMGDFTLIMVDTLAAFFDGNDINDAVQGGEFMRRLRPLTQLSGLPSVIVAAHPVKSAGDDNLVPYGSGAILNEVDGNLCLSKKDSGLVTLHWQGKLRGLEFKTVPFRLEIASSPDVVDVRGRQVLLPVMMPASEQSAEERADQETNVQLRILRILDTEEKPTLAVMESALGMDKNAIVRRLRKMQDGKLVEQILHRWVLTAKGRKALQ